MQEHRCAACGAALPPDAPWCTLCFTPVPRPAAEPVPVGAGARYDDDPASPHAPGGTYGALPSAVAGADPLEVDPPAGATDSATTAADDPATPAAQEATWPCLSCGTPNHFGENTCENCGLPFLAAARTPPQFVVPVVGDVLALPRPQQIAFISACGVVFVALVLGVMALLGLVI